jgi:hypothetical protein
MAAGGCRANTSMVREKFDNFFLKWVYYSIFYYYSMSA